MPDNTRSAASRPGRPARMSRDRILRQAVDLADDAGLESVTMRTLAHRLGAEAMSLYRHVANKEDLLDGMVDLVYEEIELPDADAGWRSSLRARAVSARSVLVRHPWAIALMESRVQPGPANLRHHEALLAVLVASGFNGRTATRIANVIDSYVYGFAIQERALPVSTPEQMAEVGPELIAALGDAFPHLARAGREFIEHGFDYGAEFEAGLDLVLAGLEAGVRPDSG